MHLEKVVAGLGEGQGLRCPIFLVVWVGLRSTVGSGQEGRDRWMDPEEGVGLMEVNGGPLEC